MTPTAAPEALWPTAPTPERVLVDVELDVVPVPKGRPRVSTRDARVYTPRETAAYEERIGWLLRQAHVRGNHNDDLGVVAVFHLPDRRQCDVDNLAKALLDGCNGVVWRDDAQVTELYARLVRGSATPGVRLVVYVAQYQPAPTKPTHPTRPRTGRTRP